MHNMSTILAHQWRLCPSGKQQNCRKWNIVLDGGFQSRYLFVEMNPIIGVGTIKNPLDNSSILYTRIDKTYVFILLDK